MTRTARAAVEYSGAYYRVIVEEDGYPLEDYTGGNHRLESQGYVGPDHPMAEDLATMKRYALSTAAEMAAEHGAAAPQTVEIIGAEDGHYA